LCSLQRAERGDDSRESSGMEADGRRRGLQGATRSGLSHVFPSGRRRRGMRGATFGSRRAGRDTGDALLSCGAEEGRRLQSCEAEEQRRHGGGERKTTSSEGGRAVAWEQLSAAGQDSRPAALTGCEQRGVETGHAMLRSPWSDWCSPSSGRHEPDARRLLASQQRETSALRREMRAGLRCGTALRARKYRQPRRFQHGLPSGTGERRCRCARDTHPAPWLCHKRNGAFPRTSSTCCVTMQERHSTVSSESSEQVSR